MSEDQKCLPPKDRIEMMYSWSCSDYEQFEIIDKVFFLVCMSTKIVQVIIFSFVLAGFLI